MENTTEETTDTETLAPDTVRETIQAQHKFSIDETLKLKDDLLAAIANENQIEAELASCKAEFKSRTEKATLEKDSILRRLTDGFDMRPTRAIIVFNQPEHGRKTFIREDNGDIIRDEPMSHADWQLPMFRNPDGKDALESTDAAPAGAPGEIVDAEFDNTVDGEGTKEDLGRIEDVPGAGQTNIGDALNGAAVKTEQPQLVIGGFGLDDWTGKGLLTAFVTGATNAGWSKASISAMRGQIKAMDNVDAIKELLKPFVIVEGPSLEDLMCDARAAFGDIGDLEGVFEDVIRLDPSKYPGGSNEGNFERFTKDVETSMEAK